MEDLKEFTISRKEWLRGEGSHVSYLRRPRDGKMCCVGIYLKACGVPENLLTGNKITGDLLGIQMPDWMRRGMVVGDATINMLYGENDRSGREHVIAKLFAKEGVSVNFTD